MSPWLAGRVGFAPVLALVVGSAALGAAYGGLQNLTLVLSSTAVHRRHHGTTSALTLPLALLRTSGPAS